jgi:Leucine-rich repeat (LRR) protein
MKISKASDLIPNAIFKDRLQKETNIIENVYSIDLSVSNLEKIPDNLDKFINLKSLDLSDNKIRKIEKLDKCVNLTRLNLSNNKIDIMEGLDKLTDLKILKINNNYIFNMKGIHRCRKLMNIDLKFNKIKIISYLNNFPDLIKFNVEGNFIQYSSHDLKFFDEIQSDISTLGKELLKEAFNNYKSKVKILLKKRKVINIRREVLRNKMKENQIIQIQIKEFKKQNKIEENYDIVF